ncbi:hypothetical protein HJC23_006078, partial [Cyclotella cryptica]
TRANQISGAVDNIFFVQLQRQHRPAYTVTFDTIQIGMRQRRPSPTTNPSSTSTPQQSTPMTSPKAVHATQASSISHSSTARVISIANALAFALNTIETAGFGPFSSRFAPNQDNASISDKYQTIITPNGIAFSIWSVIFLSEAIFVALTLLWEREGRHALVLDGASFWFVGACLAQFAWSPAFAYENLPLSLFFMGCIFLPLLMIALRQYNVTTRHLSNPSTESWKRSDYWLLQFPFEIHLAWISAALVLNTNIVVVGAGASAKTQAVVGAVSLAVLAFAALSCLFVVKRSQFTLPLVVAWATFWMSYELQNPKQLILNTFKPDQIHSFFIWTRVLSAIVVMATVVRWVFHSFMGNKVKKSSGGLSEDTSLLRSSVEAR